MTPPYSLFPSVLKDRYIPTEELGEGGMGVVYKAFDRELARSVAIKVIRVQETPILRKRFEREALALSRVKHPAILKIYSWGETDQGMYLVTEFIKGPILQSWVDQAGEKRSAEEALAPLLEVAEGLDEIHAAKMLHRDVKPGNILIEPSGQARLIDFGLVRGPGGTRLTETEQLIGTLVFLPPEVLRGGDYSEASDWYSWGATLFWVYEQRPLFPLTQVYQIAQDGPYPEVDFQNLPEYGDLAQLIRATTREKPEERLAGAAQIRTFLAGAARRKKSRAAPNLELKQEKILGPSLARRRSRYLPWVGIFLLSLVLGAAISHWRSHVPSPSAQFEPAPIDLKNFVSRLRRDLEDLRRRTGPTALKDPTRWLEEEPQGSLALSEWARHLTEPPSASEELRSQAEEIDTGFVELGLPPVFVDLLGPLGSTDPTQPPASLDLLLRGTRVDHAFTDSGAASFDALARAERERGRLVRQVQAVRSSAGALPDSMPEAMRIYSSYGLANLNETVEAAQATPKGRLANLRWLRESSRHYRQGLRAALWEIRTRPPESGGRFAALVGQILSRQEALVFGEVAYLDPWAMIEPKRPRPAERFLLAVVAEEIAEARRLARLPWEPLLLRSLTELDAALDGVTKEPPEFLRTVRMVRLKLHTRLGRCEAMLASFDADLATFVQDQGGLSTVAWGAERCWEELMSRPDLSSRLMAVATPRVLKLRRAPRRYPRLYQAVKAQVESSQ